MSLPTSAEPRERKRRRQPANGASVVAAARPSRVGDLDPPHGTPSPQPSLRPRCPAAMAPQGRKTDAAPWGTPLSPTARKMLLLGSGELGKEVVIEAQRLGIEVIACDRYAGAPAMQVA